MSQHYLSKARILAVRRVKESDLTKLAKATGGRIITNLDDLFEKDLGAADLVEERKIEEDRWVFIEGCKHPKSVTLLLRAGSQRVVDEAERSVHDAIMVVKDVMEFPSVVAGGGAPETYAATKIRSWAKSLEGREQLAAEKYQQQVLEAYALVDELPSEKIGFKAAEENLNRYLAAIGIQRETSMNALLLKINRASDSI